LSFSISTAEIVVPDGSNVEAALARTTHLALGAHQDDLEIMAIEGILACYQHPTQWFTGVVVTDGRGAPRSGPYATMSDDDMVGVRREEQKNAARVGAFSAQILLDLPSSAVKDPANTTSVDDIFHIVEACKADTIYTHNLADKHDTHVGVTLKVIAALRRLPVAARPKRLIGCEVWRDLDWLGDTDKVVMPVPGYEHLQAALLGVFDSQIAGGKRYDLAAMGRRRANATFHQSHGVDANTGAVFGMDLMPLLHNDDLDPIDFVAGYLERFRDDVLARVRRYSGTSR